MKHKDRQIDILLKSKLLIENILIGDLVKGYDEKDEEVNSSGV